MNDWTVSSPSAVAASEHPLATHAVAECVGSLIERGCTGPQVLLVVATATFGGALGDIATAFGQLLDPAEVIAVCSGELMAGARRVSGGPGIAVMAAGTPGATVTRIEPGGRPEPESGVTTVAFCDTASTTAPVAHSGAAPDDFRTPLRGRESDPLSGSQLGELLCVELVAAPLGGGSRLALVSNGQLREFRDGGLALGLPSPAGSLLEVSGFAAFGPPMRVTAVMGTSVTALDELPAAEAFEAGVAGASGVLDSATELRLRRVATECTIGVRRSSIGLECSHPLLAGELVEPVYRSPQSVALDLSQRLDGGRATRLSVIDASVAACAGHMATSPDPLSEAVSEASAGDHLGVLSAGVQRDFLGASRGADAAVTVMRLDP